MQRPFLVPKSCPEAVTMMMSRRLALFFSSLLLRLLLSDAVVSVSFCSSLRFFFSSVLLLERRASRKREKRAREEINARKFRTRKRRDVCVFSVVGRDDFFRRLVLLRCVSFKRTKDQPTNTKEEALKVFLCMYIYITRGNESRCCVLCARVSL